MQAKDLEKLIRQLMEEISSAHAARRIAVVKSSPAAYEIVEALRLAGLNKLLIGVFDFDAKPASDMVRNLDELPDLDPDIVVIAEDADKERYLEALSAILKPSVRVLVGGYGHFTFRDPIFEAVKKSEYVTSFANGYPHTLTHIFQCLRYAKRRNLSGVVVEFGMFKGGTTLLIHNFIKELGASWNVLGFDTFNGFPERRSILDMYDHPDCVFPDRQMVERVFAPLNVEVVAGDVVDTVEKLADQDIVLAFVDTDNYTSATKILDVITDRVVVGGSIVFDHFTGRDRHLYTIGERIAAKRLLGDERFFNLHDTGVFLRTS
ncbi:TylF/MycF/NovP-related O-methyltransferase [Rhizobium leguminosarum]|uniref:TylF/MycF/NovP-related O-methyltransferase n=1 Tax=Rhizobium leguminosarum TaxID=384 RepID=UPI003F985DBD